MPSASKVEKQPSTESQQQQSAPTSNALASGGGGDPLKQVQSLVDKKIRNLEKRKTKLENLRAELQSGKELAESQRKAVEKLEDVDENLEFFKDFGKTITNIFQEAQKAAKKAAKLEQLERQRQDIERVKTVLLFQRLLIDINESKPKKDFSNGTNGATKLEKERLDQLEALCKIVTPDPKSNESNVKQIDSIADHLIALYDGKNREAVKGATYKELKETLVTINDGHYFDRKPEAKTKPPKQSNRSPADKQVPAQPVATSEPPAIEPVQQQPLQANLPQAPQPQPPVQFLQDSTLAHPHDPAIVSMQLNHSVFPTPVATYTTGMPMTAAESGDANQVAGQKFEGAHIPTQTFTNANFGYAGGYGAPVSLAPNMMVNPVYLATQDQHSTVAADQNQQQQPGNQTEYAANMDHLRKSSSHDSKAAYGIDENNFNNQGFNRPQGKPRGGGFRGNKNNATTNGYGGGRGGHNRSNRDNERRGDQQNKGYANNNYSSYNGTNGGAYNKPPRDNNNGPRSNARGRGGGGGGRPNGEARNANTMPAL